MADSTDDETGATRSGPAGDDTDDRGDTVDHGDTDGGFSLSLPPISLPPLFPEDFRVLWPAPGEKLRGRVTRRIVAAALLAFDVMDAVLALTVDSAVLAGVRVVGGALLAATAFGTLGVVYVWEAAAVLTGVGELTAAPTLTALVVVALARNR